MTVILVAVPTFALLGALIVVVVATGEIVTAPGFVNPLQLLRVNVAAPVVSGVHRNVALPVA